MIDLYSQGGLSRTQSQDPNRWNIADALRSLRGLYERRRLAGGIALAITICGVAALLAMPQTYTSEVRLIAGDPNRSSDIGSQTANATQSSSLPVLNALAISTGLQSTQTYAELMQETPVAQIAISQLQLPVTPAALLSRISVTPINETAMLRLRASWRDPQTSTAIANAMAQAFIVRQRQLIAQQADSGIAFIDSGLPDAERNVRDADVAVAAFMAKHHIADAGTASSQAAGNLNALEQRIAQSQVDQRQNQAQLRAVTGQLAHTPDMIEGQHTLAPNPVVQALQNQLATLQVQAADATAKFTPRHPIVIDLQARIKQLQAQIASTPGTIVQADTTQSNQVSTTLRTQQAQLNASVQADQASISALEHQRAALLPALAQLPKITGDLQGLEQRAKLAQDSYYAMLRKYGELSVAKSTALSDLTVTQPALVEQASKSPNLVMGFGVVLLLALVSGVGIALLMEHLDGKIADDADVERITGLPILAEIESTMVAPNAAEEALRRRRVEAAHEALLDAVFCSLPAPPQVLAIIGPSQGEGKSTVAVNTAVALAERGEPVLLIDADLRRPAIHRAFRLPESPGLADILARNWPPEHVVQRTNHPNLDVVCCGDPLRVPLTYLQSPRFDRFLKYARRHYANIVIDTCALNPVQDGVQVARRADAAIMVAGLRITRCADLEQAMQRLNAANVRPVGCAITHGRRQSASLAYYTNRRAIPAPEAPTPAEAPAPVAAASKA